MSGPAPLPADARRALAVYRVLFPLGLLFLLPKIATRMIRRGGFRAHFAQRFGYFSPEMRQRCSGKSVLWIHSISVGETTSALKLARAWHAAHPDFRIVLSVTTTTGWAIAERSAAEWLEVIYNPVDTFGSVRKTLNAISPKLLVLMEGEAWPNLLAACRQRSIPIALADARLSPRSERRYLRFQQWTGPIFRMIDAVLVPDERDIARWVSIGYDKNRLHITGNIKHDAAGAAPLRRTEEFRALLVSHGFLADAPILLGGSTWAPEERMLVEAWKTLGQEFPTLGLILVPRHVERVPALVQELQGLGFKPARRTQPPEPGSDFLIVDTTGELREWMALATMVFIGKSLPGVAEIGGQNPVESAQLAKATVFGPHMENFTSVVELLLGAKGALQVADAAEAVEAFRRLLASRAEAAALGACGATALSAHEGASQRAVTVLESLL